MLCPDRSPAWAAWSALVPASTGTALMPQTQIPNPKPYAGQLSDGASQATHTHRDL